MLEDSSSDGEVDVAVDVDRSVAPADESRRQEVIDAKNEPLKAGIGRAESEHGGDMTQKDQSVGQVGINDLPFGEQAVDDLPGEDSAADHLHKDGFVEVSELSCGNARFCTPGDRGAVSSDIPHDSWRQPSKTTPEGRSTSKVSWASTNTRLGLSECQSEATKKNTSSFISSTEMHSDGPNGCRFRRFVVKVLASIPVQVFMSLVVFLDFSLMCIEADVRAKTRTTGVDDSAQSWVKTFMHVCFAIYTLEFTLRIYADRSQFVRSTWNLADVCLILVGIMEYSIELIGDATPGLGLLKVFRLCRLIKLTRFIKLFSFFKELGRLLQMLAGCIKTLVWSVLLLELIMSVWAVIAVELLDPLVQELADKGAWQGCDRCRRSFASTFLANLTLWKTVVAGDSWGEIAVPVMEAHPWTAIIFIGSLLTLLFGVLNLVVAVIVDTFAESRANDVFGRAEDLDSQETEEKRMLSKIFARIDGDHSGGLSLGELVEGAKRVQEFRHWLRVLDIDARDLEELFLIVDADGNGSIEPDEFIDAMYRMRHTDPRSATRLLKHLVTKMRDDTTSIKLDVAAKMDSLEQQVSEERVFKDRIIQESDLQLKKAGAEIEEKLQQQESMIQKAIDIAVSKASEVALEAALKAASEAASRVMTSARRDSRRLAKGAQARVRWERELSEQSATSADTGLAETLRGCQESDQASVSSESRRPHCKLQASGRCIDPTLEEVGGAPPSCTLRKEEGAKLGGGFNVRFRPSAIPEVPDDEVPIASDHSLGPIVP